MTFDLLEALKSEVAEARETTADLRAELDQMNDEALVIANGHLKFEMNELRIRLEQAESRASAIGAEMYLRQLREAVR